MTVQPGLPNAVPPACPPECPRGLSLQFGAGGERALREFPAQVSAARVPCVPGGREIERLDAIARDVDLPAVFLSMWSVVMSKSKRVRSAIGWRG